MTPAERLRLIVITDPTAARPRTIPDVVESALAGGAPAIQIRDKTGAPAATLALARRLLPLCRTHGALLFVNDRIDIALAAGADGAHLGPDDLPLDVARRIVPEGFLLGYSTDDPLEAARAEEAGADYLGCGTIWPTGSKGDAGRAIGPEGLERVVERVSIPVVGIGGITPDRVERLARTGAAGVAVIGAVMGAPDPEAACRALLAPFRQRDD